MDWSLHQQLLVHGAQELGIVLEQKKCDLLMEYLVLFEKWNRTYNLSAIRDPMAMVSLHLLDSLSIFPYLHGQRFIDVGTGGGLPGIPMAIMFPNSHFTLLDSAGKKTRFLFQVKQALNLENVDIQNCRVESFKPIEMYDGVISRAFSSLKDMTGNCKHLLTKNGRFWAMKGVVPKSEIQSIEEEYLMVNCHLLTIPNLDVERCLVELKSKTDSD
jgi:16S rRNA (guanine527-N7)-methyltransferase